MEYSDKQLAIINTAEKLFSEKGYEGTSVRDIAEMAGINVAMISYYFGSKEKLMHALFKERTNELLKKLESLLNEKSLTPIQKVEMLIDDYVERSMQKQPYHKIMIYEQMLGKNTVIADLLNEIRKKNADTIGKLIQEGQRKKQFKKNVDVVLMMNTLVGTSLHSFLNLDYYRYYNKISAADRENFQQEFKKKLTAHLKLLFKAILGYED
jgi:AcrR family transcriptional regulator